MASSPRPELRVRTLGLRGAHGDQDIAGLVGHLNDCLHLGVVHVVIDATWLTGLSRGLIHVLEDRARRFRDYGGAIWVAGARPKVQAYIVYQVPGLQPLALRFASTMESAVQDIKNGA